MRVKDCKSGYLVIVKAYWCKYGKYAYVDRVCSTRDEAEYVKASLERNDRKEFIIYEAHN